MGKKISVFIKEPGKVPRHVHISDAPENLKKIVGGEIEHVRLTEHLLVLCSAGSLMDASKYCCYIHEQTFFGTIIFCSTRITEDGEVLRDCKIPFPVFKEIYKSLWKER